MMRAEGAYYCEKEKVNCVIGGQMTFPPTE